LASGSVRARSRLLGSSGGALLGRPNASTFERSGLDLRISGMPSLQRGSDLSREERQLCRVGNKVVEYPSLPANLMMIYKSGRSPSIRRQLCDRLLGREVQLCLLHLKHTCTRYVGLFVRIMNVMHALLRTRVTTERSDCSSMLSF
jgi:hypothetical protein